MTYEPVPISEARDTLADLVGAVHYQRKCVLLSQRGKTRAALIPADLGELINQLGGPNAAMRALASAAGDSGER